MKKSIFLSLLAAIAVGANAQKMVLQPALLEETAPSLQSEKPDRQKWAGTLIWSETFDSTEWHTAQANGVAIPENMPAGWTAVDNTGNSFFWRWSTSGPRGRYTAGVGEAAFIPNNSVKVNSTSDNVTAEKGFIMLESDFYNTNQQGQAINPFIIMDSYIQFGPIDISGISSISIYFEQYHRFCCASFSENAGPKLRISHDNVNWTSYPVHSSGISSTPNHNPSIKEMSITAAAAGQNELFIRFHHVGQSHYHWSIDDITLYQPAPTDTRVFNFFVDYYSHVRLPESFSFTNWSNVLTSPLPYFVPYFSAMPLLSSTALAANYGSQPMTNLTQTTKVFKGEEEMFSGTSEPTSIDPYQMKEIVLSMNYQIPALPENMGEYFVRGILDADQEILPPNNLLSYSFNVTGNLAGYANPAYANTDRKSPFSFVGSVDGDGVGMCVMLNPSTETLPGTETPVPYILHGVNVHINSDAYNWDMWEAGDVALLQAEIYEGTTVEGEIVFDFTSPLVTSEQISIDSSFANKWAYIEFIADGGANAITPPANGTQYFVLLRMYTNNVRFFIGADKFSTPSFYSNWLCLGNSFGWTLSPVNTAMELVVSPFGQNIESDFHLSVLNQNPGTTGTHPASGATVTLYSNDNEMNLITTVQIVDASGLTTFTGLRSGSYKYKAEFLGSTETGSITATGVDVTKEVLFNIVGIENQPMANTLKLYPNPTQNLLTVESLNEPQRIEIANLLGQTLKTVANPTAIHAMDISGLATGVYVVTVVDRGNGRVSKMFVKQ
jgi:hypothetical protein